MHGMTRRLAMLIAGLLAVLLPLSGCSKPKPVAYRPAAYGQQVGGVFQCYYVDDPAEALTLIAQGLCPPGSVPTPMPESWLNQYFAYYDSPAYYNTYVPVGNRTRYVGTYHTYYTQHVSLIAAAAKAASWKGSNGKTVSGSQVDTAKMKFSTGSGSSSTMGGGSLRGGSSTSGGSSGGSVGGSSGGDSDVTSHSKSGTTGGHSKSGGTSGGSLRRSKK